MQKSIAIFATGFLEDARFCLFGIASSLALFHLVLTIKLVGNNTQFIISALLWAGLLALLWKRREHLHLNSSIVASGIGLLIIGLSIWKSMTLFWFESSYLKIVPLPLFFGTVLLASGFRGIKQYWREILIVLLLCLPDVSLYQKVDELFHVALITTKFSTFVLWYIGFDVVRQGVNITLRTGSVSVNLLCTGIASAIMLLKVSVPLIFVFSTGWRRKLAVITAAIAIPFLLSVIRVAMLAAVVANKSQFSYWHGGAGNEIFSTAAIIAFGLLCRYLLETPDPDDSDPEEELQQV